MPRKDPLASRANERKRPETFRELIRYGMGQTSIAAFLLALSDKGIVAIVIQEHSDDEKLVEALRARFPNAQLRRDNGRASAMVEAVVDFVENPHGNLALPLDIRGADFQRRVWDAVRNIPFGRTATFLEIARAIGAPRAVRAVCSACARNPLEFAIPCHRVLRSDRSYSGDPRGETGARRRLFSARPRRALNMLSKGRSHKPAGEIMKREIIRVEPLSTYLE